MKTKKLTVLIAVSLLAGGALATTKLSGPAASAIFPSKVVVPTPASGDRGTASSEEDVPRHVAYGLFFGEMLVLKKKALERERQGMKSDAMRNFHKKRANLTDNQSAVLDQIASDTNDKVIKINDKARRIIDRERARHPNGKLKEGEALPVPPPELSELEEMRKQTLLGAREQLRTALGQKEFERLDNFIQEDIKARTKGSPRRGR